jgi:hypothetical protein
MAGITLCGILMAFNIDTADERSEKVVVTVKSVVEDSTEKEVDTIIIESLPLREQVYHYLTEEKDLSRNHALGLIANGDRESTWRPAIWNPSGTSVGIFQWTGARRVKFLKAVPEYKEDWKAQIDYALLEDRGPKWCEEDFKTPQAAAYWFMRYWERPANPSYCTIKNNGFLQKYEF